MPETIDYKAVIEDLKARKTKLEQIIAALEDIAGELGEAKVWIGAAPKTIQADTFVGMNIAEAASKYLHISGRPAKNTEGISEALNRGGLNCSLQSVSAILRRNNNNGEGDVIRVGRGLWGLQEWYPGRPRRSNRQSGEEGE